MFEQIKKVYGVLDKHNRYLFFALLSLSFLVSILELFSLSMLIPLVTIFFNEGSYEYETSGYIMPQILDYIKLIFYGLDTKTILIITVLFFVIKSFIVMTISWLQYKFSFRIQSVISAKLLQKYVNEDYQKFKSYNSSYLTRNIYTEAGVFRKIVLQFVMFVFEIMLCTLLITAVILISPMIISLIILSLSVVIGIYLILTKNLINKWGKLRVKYSGKILFEINEILNGVKEITVYMKQKFFINRYKNTYSKYISLAILNGVIKSFPRPFLETLTVLFFIISIGLLFQYNYDKTYILLVLTLIISASVKLMPSAVRIINIYQQLKFFKPSADLIYDELYKLKDISISKQELKKINKISISNLTYKINNKQLFDKTNVEFNKGEIVTIYGSNGSGKTTLIDITMGLIKPDHGEVLINNEINLKHSVNEIGFVPQTVFLFDDTIYNNILIGSSDIDKVNKNKINELANHLTLDNFLKQLDKGLDTVVGQSGKLVSGGEASKIGLARALINDPKVLVLDEFSNTLDERSRIKIMEYFQTIKKDKIIIIITHDKSIKEFSDKVYLIENKKIIKQNN